MPLPPKKIRKKKTYQAAYNTPPKISNVYCATANTVKPSNSPRQTVKERNRTRKKLTERHEGKEGPEPVNGQEAEIEADDAAPSLPQLKGHGHEADDEQHSRDGADEGHGPGDAAAVGGADEQREQHFHAGEEERERGG